MDLGKAQTVTVVTQTCAAINEIQGDIVERKKGRQDTTDLSQQKGALKKTKKEQEDIAKDKHAALLTLAKKVGNYVDDSVPVHQDEEHNPVLRTWVDVDKLPRATLSHHDILLRLDGYDPARGVKLVGHRGYMLTGYGVFLNQALINCGLEFLFLKGT